MKLRGDFRDIWKLRGGRFRCVETWHSCTLETFGVHLRFGGTSVAFVGMVELWARSVVCGGRSSFPLFGELGGFWGIVETSVLRFVYIFRSVGGVLSVWEHRAVGGSSDGGVKGIPLNNPLFG